MGSLPPVIFIDADGCPVKQEVYRVARRHGLKVTVVANSRIRMPRSDEIDLVVVEGQFDAADDWIVEHMASDDIVVTSDIPLAARCLKRGSRVLDHRGGQFTEDNIGEALANRELLSHLRDMGGMTGGPAPFGDRDRSRFLHQLDQAIRVVQSVKQDRPG